MARVPGHPDQGRQGALAEADVQDACSTSPASTPAPRAHGDQQGAPVAAEGQAGHLLDLLDTLAEELDQCPPGADSLPEDSAGRASSAERSPVVWAGRLPPSGSGSPPCCRPPRLSPRVGPTPRSRTGKAIPVHLALTFLASLPPQDLAEDVVPQEEGRVASAHRPPPRACRRPR